MIHPDQLHHKIHYGESHLLGRTIHLEHPPPGMISQTGSGARGRVISSHRTTLFQALSPAKVHLHGDGYPDGLGHSEPGYSNRNSECTLEESDIPNCYHYGADPQFIRSPKIPIVIEGVRVPVIFDTGAEVSILSVKFVQSLFPGQDLYTSSQPRRPRWRSDYDLRSN